MSDKILLVGEHNPYGADPAMALYPAPDGCSGHRLCVKILGLTRGEYLRVFDRANLVSTDGPWPARLAREKASRLLEDRSRIVALGARVSAAFGVPTRPFEITRTLVHGAREVAILVLPHPSGRCLAWNDKDSFTRARAWLDKLRTPAERQRCLELHK